MHREPRRGRGIKERENETARKVNDQCNHRKKANGMMNRIQHLVKEVYESGIRLKEAELKALQAQINPHFLYNTLDSVNWLAIESGVHEISEINSALSDMYRYAAKDTSELVTLEEEVQQVRLYMTVQSLCYPERFNVLYDIPAEFMNIRCPKLIRHPLVENAIIHGLENTDQKGIIRLSGRAEQDTITISVSDNGAGADADQMNAFLRGGYHTLNVVQGNGSRNVNRRIQLKFGEAYGLEYKQNELGGITAAIRLPCAVLFLTVQGKNKLLPVKFTGGVIA